MKPEPIYLHPGTYTIAGSPVERHIHELDRHIARMQLMLGSELQDALAGIGDSLQNEPSALIRFTGAFTGLSTLLHFCSFARGVIALERGMETLADQTLVARLRSLLVPIVSSQCEILETSIGGHLEVKAGSLVHWYLMALAEIQAVKGFIGRLA